MQHDQIRQEVLKKIWDRKAASMACCSDSKNKRQQAFARKVKLISPETRDKVLRKYFIDTKLRYLAAFRKWLRSDPRLVLVAPASSYRPRAIAPWQTVVGC